MAKEQKEGPLLHISLFLRFLYKTHAFIIIVATVRLYSVFFFIEVLILEFVNVCNSLTLVCVF